MDLDVIKGKYQHPLQDPPGSDGARLREAMEKMSKELRDHLKELYDKIEALESAGG